MGNLLPRKKNQTMKREELLRSNPRDRRRKRSKKPRKSIVMTKTKRREQRG
jgi:hypothetical protein